MTETTAGVEGPEWSAKAGRWAELWAHLADPARAVVAEAAAPHRRPDGSYRFENRFRYVIAEAANV